MWRALQTCDWTRNRSAPASAASSAWCQADAGVVATAAMRALGLDARDERGDQLVADRLLVGLGQHVRGGLSRLSAAATRSMIGAASS